MPLDDIRDTPGYICGRIIAAYELIAEQAGQQLPLSDINLSATHPMYTIPRLRAGQVRKALARMRRQNSPGAAHAEAYLAELVARLDRFPERLDLEQQAAYVLGHAHQKVVGRPSEASLWWS